jgi:hypothetical protein
MKQIEALTLNLLRRVLIFYKKRGWLCGASVNCRPLRLQIALTVNKQSPICSSLIANPIFPFERRPHDYFSLLTSPFPPLRESPRLLRESPRNPFSP